MTTTQPETVDAFDAATAVTPAGDGAYTAELDEAYGVLGKPNGGYLLAVLARAAGAHVVERGRATRTASRRARSTCARRPAGTSTSPPRCTAAARA